MFSNPVLISLLSGFLGVIVGGLITYLTTRQIELLKWEKQKEAKLLEDRRKALELLSTWFDPLDRISTKVSMFMLAHMLNPAQPNTGMIEFSNELKQYKLPPPSRFLFPDSLNRSVDEITNLISGIEFSTWLFSGNKAQNEEALRQLKEQGHSEVPQTLNEFSKLGGQLQHEVNHFKELLKKEFRATYQ